MNTYPSTKYRVDREISPLQDGRIIDIAQSGRVRIRLLFDDRYTLIIIHEKITETEKSTIETFYQNNDDIAFIFTDLVTSDQYEVFFTAQPQIYRESVGPYWNVISRMIGKPYTA